MDLIMIQCPHCGYSKEMERQKIPQGTRVINCPKCKKSFEFDISASAPAPEVSDEFHFDRAAKPEPDVKYCSSCGTRINVEAVNCPQCGSRTASVADSQGVSKVALLLITFFLGGIGGHKFYQKKYLIGILYMVFFWTYIPGIVSLIEFIIYACKDEAELKRRYPQASGLAVVISCVLLVVVIAVIGIIAAIAIPQFVSYQHRAHDSIASSDLRICKTLAESYYIDHLVYPVQRGELDCSTSEDVALYYFNLGGDDYQIVSFHDEGQTAYLTSSETADVDEYDRYDIVREIRDNYGENLLVSRFHFVE